MSAPTSRSITSRVLSPLAQFREGELTTAVLMFAYSFLAMTGYNVLKPVTRGLFISNLGPNNVPWVQLGAGVFIGFIMAGYSRAIGLVPRRWAIPVTQAAMFGLLVLFWVLFTSAGQAKVVAVGFYVYGLILGILLISQFWTLANDIYDARQAKRLFGFVGAGSSLGGAAGASLTLWFVERVGSNAMLLVSAGALALCLAITIAVVRREPRAGAADVAKAGEEKGVSSGEALQLLRSSRHLKIIALVIAFAAIGANIIDQQLNMATAEAKGVKNADGISAFLALVTVWLSVIGFVIQVTLTSRIHRYLGIGFALLILPMSLGSSALLIVTIGALWTSGVARVLDTSLRYTVDKTSREILFLPLPGDLKYRAKPFIDVTVDRVAKGVAAIMLLVLISPWGLGLGWRPLSYASLTMMVLWVLFALRARKEYLLAFRQSIEQGEVRPADIRLDTADLNTIETLLSELAHSDPRRVIYAIDLLESLDKRHLVTPLLLHHETPEVRARALAVAEAVGAERGGHWTAGVERALKDPDATVRLAAVRALAAIRGEGAADLMRPYLTDPDPQMAVTAASALAASASESDRTAAEDALRALASDTREQSVRARLEVAKGLGHLQNTRFRPLLVPLMYDPVLDVAREAIRSAGKLGSADFLFVPPLVSLLRNRLLKPAAREVLVGYGEAVIDPLAYFLQDKDENVWIRRHVPSTLALIPTQRSLDVLVGALDDEDGFIRYKAGAAVERLRIERPDLKIDPAVVERHILQEALRAFGALTLHHNLFVAGGLDGSSLLSRALIDKHQRALSRIYRLLGLLYSPDDIAVVRSALNQADVRLRSGAVEYLDNLLKGDVRKRVMLLVDEMPAEERVRKGNAVFKTRVRDVEDTLAQLVHDESQVISAAAIQVIERRELWSLADDLEHVLAHRDPHDWAVFEAASWALAARRMTPERRRALWLEPLPAVELADRLRRVPLFALVSVDELFRIAALGRQVRYEGGRNLYESGKLPESLLFLLDGTADEADRADADPAERSRTIEAPAVLGLDAVLEGSPMRTTIRARETVICLSLTTDEFLSLLSENVEIAQGLFASLIETRGPEWDLVMHGELSPDLRRKAEAGWLPVDHVLLLQTRPLLARATTPQLLQLAAIARRVPLKTGVDPLLGVEPSMLLILSGRVRVERDGDAPDTAEPGDIVGAADTLGGGPIRTRAEVIAEGSALRLSRGELFDLLADHIDLLQGIFSGLLRAPRPVVRT